MRVRFCLVKGSSILMQHLTTWGKLMNTFLIWSRDPEHAECSFHYISIKCVLPFLLVAGLSRKMTFAEFQTKLVD